MCLRVFERNLKCHFLSIALHGIGQVVKVEKYREVNSAIAPTCSHYI